MGPAKEDSPSTKKRQEASSSATEFSLPHRKILMKLAKAKLLYTPATRSLAETRFADSDFVAECLEWHNHYRQHHLAPPLTLDPIVREKFDIMVACRGLHISVIFSGI